MTSEDPPRHPRDPETQALPLADYEATGRECSAVEQERKQSVRRRRKKRRAPRPRVKREEVAAFLATATARRWYAFSDSNVKRFVIRALFDLLEEMERLELQSAALRGGVAAEERKVASWVGRLSGD
jgi:hypothetical protein